MTASALVIARLRLPDGREFDVRHDAVRAPREAEHSLEEGMEFMWSEGNYACDCNRAKFLNDQHGLGLDDTRCDTELIELIALTVDGKDVLAR